MNILAVVPARSGSKGIPGKNTRVIGGKPLLAYVLEASAAANGITKRVVSTESARIAELAHAYGAAVPFFRPPELAEDSVSLIPVLQHAMRFFDNTGWHADAVLSLQPTSPLLSTQDIERSIQVLHETGCDSVVAVTQILHHHPFRAMKVDHGRILPLTEYTSDRFLQKQDRPAAYGFTGGLYLRRRVLLEEWTGQDFALGKDSRAMTIEPERAVNIDHEVDIFFFEALLRHQENQTRPVGAATQPPSGED